jgi:ribosomal protein S18 acetylase RimI-like enzyme
LIAERKLAKVGLLLHHLEMKSCEVVVLVAAQSRHTIGNALLQGMQDLAIQAGFERLWLVTTNDNLPAQSLFRKLGWKLVAIHSGAVDRSRSEAENPAIHRRFALNPPCRSARLRHVEKAGSSE